MRPSSAITATFALLLSFAQAPFAHMHRRDPDHRHATATPHSHLRLLSDQHRALHGPDDDDDAQAVDWVLLAQHSGQPLVAEKSEPMIVSVPPAGYELLRAPAPRAHDPPGIIQLPPRAPPV
ncbi:MAG: hypothetical protein ACKV22_26030 [Bryobacteraceae bacterium]